MIVKRATVFDIEKIVELVNMEFPYVNFSAEKVSKRLKDKKFKIFKAVVGKKFAGLIDLEFLDEKTVGRINGLAVLPEYRGKNFGKKLLRVGISFFKRNNVEKIILLVGKNNTIAKSLYESAGFDFSRPHFKKIFGKEIEEFELELKKTELNYVS